METVTITLTSQQHQMVLDLFAQAAARDKSIAQWTGESEAQIEARYQVPGDDLLEDMAEHFAAQQFGVSFS